MMKAWAAAIGMGLVLAVSAAGQTANRRNIVRATGDGTAYGPPDQARIVLAVETRAATAQDAAAQNAGVTSQVVQALAAAMGANPDIKTSNYTLTPVYSYPPNATPTLVGYSVTNSVEVTTGSLSTVGRLLDTATAAGANRVQSLAFFVKDSEPLRAQALRIAVQRARMHAEAMVGGIGLRLGAVLLMQEGGTTSPIIYADSRSLGAGTTTTPIEPGTVNVYAQVTVEYEIIP